ncbi:uncharacterized protein LOC131683398 [Topomyia yanbarensis]|uniref:uncharacterized protein LOC131683398 n=1 Tax=Topomyia yanbarensis TaxID=2498891 RepID=UPI00273C1DD1|nr:uncharacterized protein LOC131683398 [Topomyia yanbarensis]
MGISKNLKVCLVLCCVVVSISADKKKRGLYHGLSGYTIPLGVGGYRSYHSSSYAKLPGFYKGYGGHGGVLPPGYALFPGSASVASYHRNFPKIPTVYTPSYLPPLGAPSTVLRPVTNFAPVAPVAPAYPVAPQIPAAQVPTYFPVANPQHTSFFATYPQKPFIPVAVPALEKPKVPLFVQKPLYTSFTNVIPTGVLPTGVYNPAVGISNVSPTFVGVPIAGPTASTPTVSTATVTQTGQQPWRPVVLHHPTPTPITTTAYKPSLNLLPPYTLSTNGQEQIYISSTPAPHIHDSQQQQQHQQTLLDLEQASLHHQSQDDGNGAFNGQPYDVASNHDRYSGPSSYDVDITHNGYQKK